MNDLFSIRYGGFACTMVAFVGFSYLLAPLLGVAIPFFFGAPIDLSGMELTQIALGAVTVLFWAWWRRRPAVVIGERVLVLPRLFPWGRESRFRLEEIERWDYNPPQGPLLLAMRDQEVTRVMVPLSRDSRRRLRDELSRHGILLDVRMTGGVPDPETEI